jgi:HK97 family phage portal protein
VGIIRKALGLQTLSETPAEGVTGDYSANVTPPPRVTTAREPMGLPAFYRSVVTVTNMAAPMTINSWRAGVTVASPLVEQPDPWMTRRRFMARTIVNLLLKGNAYWRILRAADGTPTGLRVADHGRAYRATGGVRYQLIFDGVVMDLAASEIEHLRFLEIPGVLDGLGPVQACRAALEGIAAVRDYADNWFGGPDAINGVLTTDQRIDRPTIQETKRQWYTPDDDGVNPTGGPSIRVLGSGVSYESLALNPEDAQWLQAQAWGVLDIARLLGLPGDYLLAAVEGSSLTYTNLEMVDTSFVKRTLLPDYLQQIEEALTNVIPRGQTARFDLADFLRPDAKTRADIDAIYIAQQVYGPGYVQQRDRITDPQVTAAAPAGGNPA